MDYHPKHIMVTCVYLACKVEEFNVTMQQFVMNVRGDRAKASDIVLNNELLLMQQLKYHLTTHNPFRSVEGFLIDIKVNSSFQNFCVFSFKVNILIFIYVCFLPVLNFYQIIRFFFKTLIAFNTFLSCKRLNRTTLYLN